MGFDENIIRVNAVENMIAHNTNYYTAYVATSTESL